MSPFPHHVDRWAWFTKLVFREERWRSSRKKSTSQKVPWQIF
jgi:hypothetical protein